MTGIARRTSYSTKRGTITLSGALVALERALESYCVITGLDTSMFHKAELDFEPETLAAWQATRDRG
jgi:hypothetical protein